MAPSPGRGGSRGTATLTIDPFEPILSAERTALMEEAARLLEITGGGGQIVVRAPTS
jgi:hypothetical protein